MDSQKLQEIIVGMIGLTNYKSNWDSMIDGIMQYDLDNVYIFGQYWTVSNLKCKMILDHLLIVFIFVT